MSDDLNRLIDEAAIFGNLTGGESPAWLAQHADPRLVAVLAHHCPTEATTGRGWLPEEEAFLRQHHTWLTPAEIAQHLGRTPSAVLNRRRKRLHIPGVTVTHPGDEWMTMHQAGVALGLPCTKCVSDWVARGLIAARPLPVERYMMVISRATLTQFAVNPENWVYFQPERVADPKLRRLVALRRERWADDWWSPGQAAAYHDCSTSTIGDLVRAGKIPAKRWGNWWIKRSDALAVRVRVGDQTGRIDTTEAGDHFLLLGLGIGLSYTDISGLCGWRLENPKRAEARLWFLRRKGLLERLISRSPYGVQYDPDRKLFFADWRLHRHKFPRLDRAVRNFQQSRANEDELRWVGGVLSSWTHWHARTPEQSTLAYRLRHSSQVSAPKLARHYVTVRSWGIDPLE